MVDPVVRGAFGAWLHALRSRMGLSQNKMAARVGLTGQYYQLLELGYRCPGPTLRIMLSMMADNVALDPQPECKAPRLKRAPTVPQSIEGE
jgi:transcriptional regulator with XRE-family HTH domain